MARDGGWHRSCARMHDDLRERIRVAAGRTGQPTAAIIDSQSVKGSEMIARTSRGYDAGKKINGTRRHLAVDTIGLLLAVLVTAASVQDRDAARPLLWNLRRAFPSIRLAWADGGYAGKLVTWARARLRLALEIVKRPAGPGSSRPHHSHPGETGQRNLANQAGLGNQPDAGIPEPGPVQQIIAGLRVA